MSARSLLQDGLMQSDLDAAFHKILNLDTSNLGISGPETFPPVLHKWLKSYNETTQLFDATQPDILDLSGFPSQAGQAGKVLSTNGTILGWSVATGNYINVKSAPYNAQGDGSTDDYAAINQAITDANGRMVYFPKGVYFIKTNLAPASLCNLIGDGARASIIRGWTGLSGTIITLVAGSVVQDLCVDGLLPSVLEPVNVNRNGIGVSTLAATGAPAPPASMVNEGVKILNCRVTNCAGTGIRIFGADNTVIASTEIDNCGVDGVLAENSPKTAITGCRVVQCTGRGLRLINSPQSFVKENAVSSCGLTSAGIEALDSDNTVIQGNRVQQCAFGLIVLSSSGRAMQSYGMSITGNILVRNYVSGVQVTLSHGFCFTGNTVADNGQGGSDNTILTMEPGISADSANPGSGYVVGDVLTLVGGTGGAAKVLVKKVFTGGALWSTSPLDNDALHPISFGSYSGIPANPVSVTGGHGSGAKVNFTAGIISNPGSGYVAGEVLRSTNGTFTNPVRIMVTKVGSGGTVLGFIVLDGGGYAAGFAVGNVLVFTPDSLSDGQGTGSGLTITPNFTKRYSANFNGFTQFGLCLLGNIFGGIISGNNIVTTRNGVGILIQDGAVPYNIRAAYLTISGNSIMNNTLKALAGQTVGGPLDENYNFNSVIANNILYPT